MPEVPAVPDAGALDDRVAAIFDPDRGPLASRLDGFEPREGQRELARRIARTFRDGGVLLAEAGTGTGKTLAYLIPAVLAGRRVLISTGTRNLQDQIFYKDVPALARVFGRPIRATYMKGRSNYLCLHRFARLSEAAAGLAPSDQRWLAHITEWTSVTETGDRAEIDDLPDDLPLWTELTATSDQCLGRDCPAYRDCFITKMRDRAAESELVIVNHHLLCADASVRQGEYGEVIPESDLLVIDEAHQLEDVATQYFGVALGTHRFDDFARDAAAGLGSLGPQDGAAASHALAEIHTGQDKIITIEDPVEYHLPGVVQIPVNEKKGLTFSRGLRSILRHDPDRVMVGEIRDAETAQIAVQAALTGHLVFSTVHANNAFDVIGRFMHMGLDLYNVVSALNAVLAQRLVRLTCKHCAKPFAPDAATLARHGVVNGQFMKGEGCGHCRGTGYKGRRAVAELLKLDDGLRDLIAGRAPMSDIKAAARARGMKSLRDMALAAVCRGETTFEELERVTLDE